MDDKDGVNNDSLTDECKFFKHISLKCLMFIWKF